MGRVLVAFFWWGEAPERLLISPERLACAASKRSWAENTAEPRVYSVPPCPATLVFGIAGWPFSDRGDRYMIDHGSAVDPA